MKYPKYNNSLAILFLAFFIATLLFPTSIINKIVFATIIGIAIINTKIYRVVTISPIIIFFIFLFGYVNSFSNHVDKDLSLQFFLSIMVLFLIYPIKKYSINLDRIAKISGLSMAIFTGISFLVIVVFNELPFHDAYLKFFSVYCSGGYGIRDFLEDGVISFHLGTVPFLFLPFILYVISFSENKKISHLIASLILLTTIVMSASRGLIISCLIGAIYIFFSKSKPIIKTISLILSIPVLIIIVSYLLSHTNIFSSNEYSNSVKIGHIESFLENLNFKNFFIGDGLASFYYSKGSQKLLAHTEVTPIDMLRYLGFIFMPLLYYAIIFPVKRLQYYLDNKSFLILFSIYLLNSMTNPIMFNSYGLLIVLWYWHKIINISNVKQEEVAI
jgi:hypothetical protein